MSTDTAQVPDWFSNFVQGMADYGKEALTSQHPGAAGTTWAPKLLGYAGLAIGVSTLVAELAKDDPNWQIVETEAVKVVGSILGATLGAYVGGRVNAGFAALGAGLGGYAGQTFAQFAYESLRTHLQVQPGSTAAAVLANAIDGAFNELATNAGTLSASLSGIARSFYAESYQRAFDYDERLIIGGGQAELVGGGARDYLFGTDGGETLAGMAGADVMVGGNGDDVYIVDDSSDEAHELMSQGIDQIVTSVAYTLSANVENGTIASSVAYAATLTGNELDNILTNASNWGQTLHGGAGADKLYGGIASDVLDGGNDSDVDYLVGGLGDDVYDAFSGDIVIDSDNRGSVSLAGRLLTGGTFLAKGPNGDDIFQSRDGQILYSYSSAAGVLSVTSPNGVLTIQNFHPVRRELANLPSLASLGIDLRYTSTEDAPPEAGTPPGKLPVQTGVPQAGNATVRRDPLVLDLDGDGALETQGVADGVNFDMDGSGFAERTGWVGSEDGLLVRDVDGNGTINTGRELFGDQTLLPNGSTASNGFQALAALDTNADGKVDANDAAWSELRVWRDSDADGAVDAGELLSMSDAGITSLATAYTSPNTTDSTGNTLAQRGTFTRADGSTGQAGSFLFGRSTIDSVPTELVDVPDSISALPNLQGFGAVYDLRQAMARDSQLASMVEALKNSTDYKTLRAQFDAVVQRWTGADQVVAGSRGTSMDAKHLAVVEKFNGQGFMGADGPNPNAVAAPILESTYQQLVTELFVQFLPQAQLKDVWSAVQFSWDDAAKRHVPDFAGAVAAMQAKLGSEPSETVALLWEFAAGAKALGLTTDTNFSSAFEAAFDGSPFAYDKLIDYALAGVPVTIGTGNSDTINLNGKGIVYSLQSGDVIVGSSLDDVVIAGAGSDSLSGGNGNDYLDGGEGNDTLDGGQGADFLRGGAGNDVLGGVGSNSADPGFTTYSGSYSDPGAGNTYEGGTGDDTLNGTSRADLYIFNVGDGSDIVIEPIVSTAPGGQVDILRLGAGITPGDVVIVRGTGSNANDLIVKVGTNGTDQITIKNWYTSAGYRVERLEFADGTVWTDTDLTNKGLVVVGTDSADTLTGLSGYVNTIEGGAGNDVITGGAYGDTLLGGAGNDQLFGQNGSDTLDGGDGDDTLDGGQGADVLRGGAGNDVLGGVGSNSADPGFTTYSGGYSDPGAGNTYEGGAGSDTLNGTSRADLYVFNIGDGADVIIEPIVSTAPNGQVDILRLGPGITPADITVVRGTGSAVNDLIIKVGAGGTDQVTIKNWYSNAGYRVERLEFADGSVWTDVDLTNKGLVMAGTDGADSLTGLTGYANTIDGGAGNDVIAGGAYGDTLLGGAGNDSLSGSSGNDLLDGGDGDDTLDGGSGADVLRGGAGNDVLGGVGSSSDPGYTTYSGGYADPGAGNTYEGGTGDDTLYGTSRADLYLFNLGDGEDTLIEPIVSTAPSGQVDVLRMGAGIAPGDITVVRGTGSAVNDLIIKVGPGGTDQVTIKNWYSNAGYRVERLEFADGSVWTDVDLTNKGLVVAGTDGADSLTGLTGYANTIDGGAGNDIITGGNLGDTLLGGAGNDTLNGNYGNDLLDGGDGDDTLDGGSGADVLRGGAGNDILGGTGASNSDAGYNSTGSYYGPGAGNTYEGGAGNDTLNGTSMADLFLFNLGDGADAVIEPLVSGSPVGQVDVLRLGAGITPNDISVVRGTGSAVNDLIIKVGAAGTDQVTLKNWYAGAVYRIEQLQFADGTVWTDKELTARVTTIVGTADADTLAAPASTAAFLAGLEGADTLTGSSSADILVGGASNDALFGGLGDDVYRWVAGDGLDLVTDAGGNDTLEMTGLDMGQVSYWRQGDDLLIEVGGATEGVVVKDHFLSSNANKLEGFYLNGIYMSSSDMALMAAPKT